MQWQQPDPLDEDPPELEDEEELPELDPPELDELDELLELEEDDELEEEDPEEELEDPEEELDVHLNSSIKSKLTLLCSKSTYFFPAGPIAPRSDRFSVT